MIFFNPALHGEPAMTFSTHLRLGVLASALAASFSVAAQPAIVYDMGGKFDKSFNEAAYDGAGTWKKESGNAYLEFEISNESQREQAMRRMAERGASPIIAMGFAQASAIEKVAKEFPKLQFAIIDVVVRPAQRAVHRLQGTRGQLPGGHDGGHAPARPARWASSAAWTSR